MYLSILSKFSVNLEVLFCDSCKQVTSLLKCTLDCDA